MTQPALPVFRDELLKGLEANLRKQNVLITDQNEILRDMRDQSAEMVKVLKELKKVLTAR